jgi:hypothetical protein
MQHVKFATRGMNDSDLGDISRAGYTGEDDETEGMLVTRL